MRTEPTEASVRPGHPGAETSQTETVEQDLYQRLRTAAVRTTRALAGTSCSNDFMRRVVLGARRDDSRVPAELIEIADELQGALDAGSSERREEVRKHEDSPPVTLH